MLSKQEIQIIRSLGIKKYRQKYHKYLAEGEKISLEIIDSSPESIDCLYCLSEFYENNAEILQKKQVKTQLINKKELGRISQLKNPNNCLVVLNLIEPASLSKDKKSNIVLYLDGISDPGNLGTIMRTVEWFGVDLLLLSPECVDPYNPKVIQSAMGSMFRINFKIMNIELFLEENPEVYTVYIADMNGTDAFKTDLKTPALLVLGNESRGVRAELTDHHSNVISIPSVGNSTESLNVGIAGAILMAEFYKKNG